MGTPRVGYTGYIEKELHHDYGGDTVFGFWIYILSDCVLLQRFLQCLLYCKIILQAP